MYSMLRYIIKRILQSIIVLIGVTFISFGVMFLTGDPTMLLLGENTKMSAEEIEVFRHQMGFDRPWVIQYLDYVNGLLHGDMGKSFYHGRPNFDIIIETFPRTIQLAMIAFLITVMISMTIGILSAVKKDSAFDRISMVLSLFGQSMPTFWLAILMILVFAVKLKWLPVSGMGTWKHLVMPSIALSVYSVAKNSRMIRSCMLEVLNEDYIRTARAKGQSEFKIVMKHGLRNALIPVVTLFGIQFGSLLGGAVVTETVFAWPGIGRLAIQAINTKDLFLVQACVLTLAVTFIVLNLLVDLSYTFLDPRIKLR